MKAYFTVIILIHCFLISCSKDEDIGFIDPSTYHSNESAFETKQELLQKGWKVIESFKVNSSSDLKLTAQSRKPITITNEIKNFPYNIPIKENNLATLGYDIRSSNIFAKDKAIQLLNIFRSEHSVFPLSIRFTPSFYVEKPGIAPLNYNYPKDSGDARIVMNKPQIFNIQHQDLPDHVIVNRIVENRSDTILNTYIPYTYDVGYKTSWEREELGLLNHFGSYGAYVTVNLPNPDVSFNNDLPVSIDVGGNHNLGVDTSKFITRKDSVEIQVPPHSKVEVREYLEVDESSANYMVPYSLDGVLYAYYSNYLGTGEKFLSRRHFIGDHAKKFTLTPEKGRVKVTQHGHIHIIQSPPEPI